MGKLSICEWQQGGDMFFFFLLETALHVVKPYFPIFPCSTSAIIA